MNAATKSMLWADAVVDGRGSIERFHQREVRVRERSKCRKCSRGPLRSKSDPQCGFYVRMEKRSWNTETWSDETMSHKGVEVANSVCLNHLGLMVVGCCELREGR